MPNAQEPVLYAHDIVGKMHLDGLCAMKTPLLGQQLLTKRQGTVQPSQFNSVLTNQSSE